MPEKSPIAKDARSARRWCCCVLLAILWCASLPLACLPGPVPVAVADVWQALGAVVGLCPPADGSVQLVVGQIRLARVLLGLLCGGALAVAGVALQGVLRNPLADPFTLGISAGAACGASMAIALGGTLGIWAGGLAVGLSAAATVSLAALLGSLLALGGALWLGSGQGSFRRAGRVPDRLFRAEAEDGYHPGRYRRGGLSGCRGGPGQSSQRRIRHQHRFLDHGQPARPWLGQRSAPAGHLAAGAAGGAAGLAQAGYAGIWALPWAAHASGCWPAPAA